MANPHQITDDNNHILSDMLVQIRTALLALENNHPNIPYTPDIYNFDLFVIPSKSRIQKSFLLLSI